MYFIDIRHIKSTLLSIAISLSNCSQLMSTFTNGMRSSFVMCFEISYRLSRDTKTLLLEESLVMFSAS